MMAKTNINKVMLIELQKAFNKRTIVEHYGRKKITYENNDEIIKLKLPKNYGNNPYLKEQVDKFISDCEIVNEAECDGERSDIFDFIIVTLYGRNHNTIASFRINLKHSKIIEKFNSILNIPSN